MMEIRFKLEKETKGALRYQEVDDKGEVIEQAWAKIGTLYVRKSAFERGAAFPQLLRLTSLTGGLFPRPRYPTTERNKMSTDHRENVMKVIEHVREERREIVSDIVERKG